MRPYGSWRPLWDMISRCAFAQLNYSTTVLVGLMAGMAFTYLVPPLLLLSHSPVAMVLGAAAWLASPESLTTPDTTTAEPMIDVESVMNETAKQ